MTRMANLILRMRSNTSNNVRVIALTDENAGEVELYRGSLQNCLEFCDISKIKEQFKLYVIEKDTVIYEVNNYGTEHVGLFSDNRIGVFVEMLKELLPSIYDSSVELHWLVSRDSLDIIEYPFRGVIRKTHSTSLRVLSCLDGLCSLAESIYPEVNVVSLVNFKNSKSFVAYLVESYAEGALVGRELRLVGN